jgi:hypothetical protein
MYSPSRFVLALVRDFPRGFEEENEDDDEDDSGNWA